MRCAAGNSRWQRIVAATGSLCFLAMQIAAKDDLPPGVLLTAHTLQANHKLLARLPLPDVETVLFNGSQHTRSNAMRG